MLLYLKIILMFMVIQITTDDEIIKELDATWAEMSRAVKTGDSEAYAALYHPDAVLVSGYSKNSYPIANALADWKKGFDDTKAGKIKASATFRMSKRLHDKTTAHETGMFYYYTINEKGKLSGQYVHMNALLVKKNGKWLLMMEYQKGPGTKEEWDALK